MNESINAAIADVERALNSENSSSASEKHASLVLKLGDAARAPSATSFDAVLSILDHLETEVPLSLPKIMELQTLSAELQNTIILRIEKAAQDIAQTGNTAIFGLNLAEETSKLQEIATKIALLAAKKVAQINTLTAALNAGVAEGSPPPPPVDNVQGSDDDGRMEARLSKLESDVAAIKIDIAVIKANGATKADIAELRSATQSDIAELKSATQSDIAELKSSNNAAFAELKSSNKADIAELKSATQSDIAELKSSNNAAFVELKSSNKTDIAELKSANKSDLAELKGTTKTDIAQLDASLRVAIADAKTAIILWSVSAIILAQLLPAILKQLPELVAMFSK